jgi:heme-degrading monooxygenase HmoA
MLKYKISKKVVMVKIIEMDENVTLTSQLEEDAGPVIVLNKFTVKPEDVDEFLKVFEDTTKKFKQQPGFISAQLHRGIGGSSTFFNYVVWESAGHFKQAFSRPEFRSSMADVLPKVTMSPHLFKKVAVPGICVE